MIKTITFTWQGSFLTIYLGKEHIEMSRRSAEAIAKALQAGGNLRVDVQQERTKE